MPISPDTGSSGMEGIDTRSLVRRIRIRGAMKGVLSSVDLDDASLVAKAKASLGLVGRDLVREVIPEGAGPWDRPLSHLDRMIPEETSQAGPSTAGPLVVALDYGMK